MLYMKVVGKTQDEVCGNILACFVGINILPSDFAIV